ncbi:MAG: MFS transporter [Promethearchaeota archaeon]
MEKNNENNAPKSKTKEKEIVVTKLGAKNTLVLLTLSISGQIAWAVENTWFNTFVYDEITPDSTPIAWMVALSAITAALTTLIIGTLSDRTRSRWGRRRPYILFGYIIWGLVTAIFPESALVHDIGTATVLVVILDCVMTFFGSTANDAAFNAWTTDISDSTNRGRVQGILNFSALVANLIAFGVAGIIIDKYGYFVFFYILGGSVSIMGLIAGWVLEEPKEVTEQNIQSPKKGLKSLWIEIGETLSPKTIKENKVLYLLFTNMAIINTGFNIFFPYLFIYMQYVVGFSKTLISVAGGIFILAGMVMAILYGMISHKFNRRSVLLLSTPVGGVCLIIETYISTNIIAFGLLYLIVMIAQLIGSISLFAWIQDKYPQNEIGKFQGVRLIFMVAIPMALGAPLGSLIIHKFGTPAIIDGKPGYIPVPQIFLIGAIFILISIIPLLFIKHEEGMIIQTKKDQ